MTMQITKKDVGAARNTYWWLLLAPVMGVPCWLIFSITTNSFASGYSSAGGAFLSASVPLVFYLPVFVRVFSENLFVRAHARQAAILLGLRFVSAFLFGIAISGSSNDMTFLIGLCNLFLWFVGSIAGLVQAGHGNAWLGSIHAEIIAAAPQQPAQPQNPAIESYLKAFRSGDEDARKAAAFALENLGQVETF